MCITRCINVFKDVQNISFLKTFLSVSFFLIIFPFLPKHVEQATVSSDSSYTCPNIS